MVVYYLNPKRGKQYCNRHVCTYFCLSICLHILKTTCTNFAKFYLYVGHGSFVLQRFVNFCKIAPYTNSLTYLQWQYNVSWCTSDLQDDVMFSHNEWLDVCNVNRMYTSTVLPWWCSSREIYNCLIIQEIKYQFSLYLLSLKNRNENDKI